MGLSLDFPHSGIIGHSTWDPDFKLITIAIENMGKFLRECRNYRSLERTVENPALNSISCFVSCWPATGDSATYYSQSSVSIA